MRKIISVCQSGADIAGIDAAIMNNFPYGGWVSKGKYFFGDTQCPCNFAQHFEIISIVRDNNAIIGRFALLQILQLLHMPNSQKSKQSTFGMEVGIMVYRFILATLILVAFSSCATKQYPQAPMVTTEESATYDCKAIDQEIVKTRSIQEEIDRTGEFDGRTVLGFLGDFGIGNGMAKSTAYQKAQDRLQQLESLKASKCTGY